MSSSSSAEGGGKGLGEGLLGVLLGLIARLPAVVLTGLFGCSTVALSFSTPSPSCSRPVSDACSNWAVTRSVTLPSWLVGLPGSEAAGGSSSSLGWLALRLWRISGLERARLALVGDAKDGRFNREDRRVALSEEGSLDSFTGTLVVGDVLRRLGADASIWAGFSFAPPLQLRILKPPSHLELIIYIQVCRRPALARLLGSCSVRGAIVVVW
ncbi:hypothetical protein RRF57_009003 [Xylaria bambusicola]|uniref:Uncharacterized protein n=1 Tax=Xylaria bambusicola TaxID=326684 RepID=A0AAN7Z177_9PEZI